MPCSRGLAKGTTRLANFSTGADPHSTLGCMEALGAKVQVLEDKTNPGGRIGGGVAARST